MFDYPFVKDDLSVDDELLAGNDSAVEKSSKVSDKVTVTIYMKYDQFLTLTALNSVRVALQRS